MDGLERHPVLQERYLLVLPKGYTGPRDDLGTILKRMPLVRFADTTSVGRQIEQHLRRLKLRPPRVIQADRSSMVTACVASGAGVTFLTPSLLIDGFVERMELDVLPMPVAGMTRSITVLAREDELGALPARFAQMARTSLTAKIADCIGTGGQRRTALMCRSGQMQTLDRIAFAAQRRLRTKARDLLHGPQGPGSPRRTSRKKIRAGHLDRRH